MGVGIIRGALKYNKEAIYICDYYHENTKNKPTEIAIYIEDFNINLPPHTILEPLDTKNLKVKKVNLEGGKLFGLNFSRLFVVPQETIKKIISIDLNSYIKKLESLGKIDEFINLYMQPLSNTKQKQRKIQIKDVLLYATLDSADPELIDRKLSDRGCNTSTLEFLKERFYEKVCVLFHDLYLRLKSQDELNFYIEQRKIEKDSTDYLTYEDIARLLDVSYEKIDEVLRRHLIHPELVINLLEKIKDHYVSKNDPYGKKYIKTNKVWISFRKILRKRCVDRKRIYTSYDNIKDFEDNLFTEIVKSRNNQVIKHYLISGKAGIGKTKSVLNLIKRLRDAGIRATYIATLKSLADSYGAKTISYYASSEGRRKELIKSSDVVFIDEASYLTVEQLGLINELIQRRKTVVLIGDILQTHTPKHFSLFKLFFYTNLFNVIDLDECPILRTSKLRIDIISKLDKDSMENSDKVLLYTHFLKSKEPFTALDGKVEVIHKAQGLEFDSVYAVVDSSDELTVYTALTRAKKHIILQTEDTKKLCQIIQKLIDNKRLPKEVEIYLDFKKRIVKLHSFEAEHVESIEPSELSVISEDIPSHNNFFQATTQVFNEQAFDEIQYDEVFKQLLEVKKFIEKIDSLQIQKEPSEKAKRRGRKPIKTALILQVLKKKEMSFSELRKETNIKKNSLCKLLNYLRKKGEIEYDKERRIYRLKVKSDKSQVEQKRILEIQQVIAKVILLLVKTMKLIKHINTVSQRKRLVPSFNPL
ncbi:MAG: AAA family ATPase [Caldisericum sp.]